MSCSSRYRAANSSPALSASPASAATISAPMGAGEGVTGRGRLASVRGQAVRTLEIPAVRLCPIRLAPRLVQLHQLADVPLGQPVAQSPLASLTLEHVEQDPLGAGVVTATHPDLGDLNAAGPVHVAVIRPVDPLGDVVRRLQVPFGAGGVAALELDL